MTFSEIRIRAQKTTSEMLGFYGRMVEKYPIVSIEDPMDEHDWDGFSAITKNLGIRVQIVGDDLFVTNTDFVRKGISKKAANAVLIKLNQIGTVSETVGHNSALPKIRLELYYFAPQR